MRENPTHSCATMAAKHRPPNANSRLRSNCNTPGDSGLITRRATGKDIFYQGEGLPPVGSATQADVDNDAGEEPKFKSVSCWSTRPLFAAGLPPFAGIRECRTQARAPLCSNFQRWSVVRLSLQHSFLPLPPGRVPMTVRGVCLTSVFCRSARTSSSS